MLKRLLRSPPIVLRFNQSRSNKFVMALFGKVFDRATKWAETLPNLPPNRPRLEIPESILIGQKLGTLNFSGSKADMGAGKPRGAFAWFANLFPRLNDLEELTPAELHRNEIRLTYILIDPKAAVNVTNEFIPRNILAPEILKLFRNSSAKTTFINGPFAFRYALDSDGYMHLGIGTAGNMLYIGRSSEAITETFSFDPDSVVERSYSMEHSNPLTYLAQTVVFNFGKYQIKISLDPETWPRKTNPETDPTYYNYPRDHAYGPDETEPPGYRWRDHAHLYEPRKPQPSPAHVFEISSRGTSNSFGGFAMILGH